MKNLPVLANLLLQTEGGKLKVSATNLEIGVIKRVNAEIIEEGEITLPARTLLELISSLGGEKITLESSGEQAKITTKNFNGVINGISASEFPQIPLSQEEGVFINAKVLKESLPQITFAAANDEGRPILTGILTEIKKDSLELVATDGFRLAHKTVKVDTGKEKGSFRVLIPRKTFEEVVRLISEDLAEEDESVKIALSENQSQIIFKIGQTEVSSRLIEGQFPAWEKIIPQKFENRSVLERGELAKALKLASVFAKDSSNIVKVETGEGKIKLISEAKELGSQETEVEGQIEGSPINIAFNNKFLTEALSAGTSSQVSVEFSGNLSPALIKPLGEEGLEYVIMPIRIN